MEIKELQELMRNLYFKSDSKRGVLKTFLWFVEEVGELSEMIRKLEEINETSGNINKKSTDFEEELRLNLKMEFADVLAWLSSLANLLNIDLEETIKLKYPNFCPKCKQNPCICEK